MGSMSTNYPVSINMRPVKKNTLTSKITNFFNRSKLRTSDHQLSPCNSSNSLFTVSTVNEIQISNSPLTSVHGRNNNNKANSDDTSNISGHYVSINPLNLPLDPINCLTNTHQSHQSCSKQRFVINEDGTHEHHLKSTKRQEKLSSMIRNILGGQKLRGESKSAVPEILMNSTVDPPSLLSCLMRQVYVTDSGDPYSGATQTQGKGSFNDKDVYLQNRICFSKEKDTLSFAEKYGICKEVIGKGTFGVVRICHKKITNLGVTEEKIYAVKEFKRKQSDDPEKYSKRLSSEFCISSYLTHENIITTLDLFQDAKGNYCEVMEYCSGGDLFTLIIAAGKLEYMEADCYFKQLVRGVNYMHNMGIVHRDLKPENILLTSNGILKITDFGNGECFKVEWDDNIQLSKGICGSSPYIAPEQYTHDEFDSRPVDIWACGVIYMAMRTGRQLWKSAQQDDNFYTKYLRRRRDMNGYEPIEQLKRARCRNVLYSILDPVPNRRINAKQILASEWGQEIECCHDNYILQ